MIGKSRKKKFKRPPLFPPLGRVGEILAEVTEFGLSDMIDDMQTKVVDQGLSLGGSIIVETTWDDFPTEDVEDKLAAVVRNMMPKR